MKGIYCIVIGCLVISTAARASEDVLNPEGEIDKIASRNHQRKATGGTSENNDYTTGEVSSYKYRVHKVPALPFHHAPFNMLKMMGLAHGSVPDALRELHQRGQQVAPHPNAMFDSAEAIPGELNYHEVSLRDHAPPYQVLGNPGVGNSEVGGQPRIVPDEEAYEGDVLNQVPPGGDSGEIRPDEEGDESDGEEPVDHEIEKNSDKNAESDSSEEDSDSDGPYPHPPAPQALRQDDTRRGGSYIHSMSDIYFLDAKKGDVQSKSGSNSSAGGHPPQGSQPQVAPQTQQHHIADTTLNSGIFIAVVVGCSVAGVVGLIVAGVCWYRLQKNVKAASEVEYPAYGVTGPTNGKERIGSPGDRKLAQSAQMYHYQHQKQQMIAMEKAHGDLNKDGSDVDSEEENEEGDYTVFECPGLAPTGEMEVKNPLFSEETPVTPSGGETRSEHK